MRIMIRNVFPELRHTRGLRPVSAVLAGFALLCCCAVQQVVGFTLSDTYGYKYIDNNNEPDGPQYNFADISATGTSVSLADDGTTEGVSLGFDFKFYDDIYHDVFISANGLLRFGASTTSWHPTGLPNSGQPNNIICALWTDLDPSQGGTIHYQSLGESPNRRFVVQFTDIELEESNIFLTPPKYSFQMVLFETTDAIEFHYKRWDPIGSVSDERHTIGIEDVNGTRGLQYYSGNSAPSSSFHTFGANIQHAIRFERPLFVTVASDYGANKVSPATGVLKSYYGTEVRFEAPPFVYLNENMVELPGISDDARFRAVLKGYTIDGQPVQGADNIFVKTITQPLKVEWEWELEYAVIIESAAGAGGDPDPTAQTHWVPKDTIIAPEVDNAVGEGAGLGTRFQLRGFELSNGSVTRQFQSVSQDIPSGRATAGPYTIADWMHIKWLWVGEVRYIFDASTAAGLGLRSVNGEPFVRLYDTNGVNSVTYFGPTTNAVGAGPNVEVWLPTGRKVDVGCFYRDADGCLTLAGPTPDQPNAFTANPVGDLPSSLKLSTLVDTILPDSEGTPRVARVHTVAATAAPSEIHWLFGPTTYRAEIPLGQGLDAVTPNSMLVPALCGDAPELRSGNQGPGGPFIGPKPDLDDPGVPEGDAAVWDRVGKVLFPVHPGNHKVSWPDANLAATTYTIELVSGFPGDTMPLSSVREHADGQRITTTNDVSVDATPPALDGHGQALTNGIGQALYYVKTVTLPPIVGSFPGAPTAHYRHLYDAEGARRAPTKLDDNDSDRWLFRQKTFMESTVGAVINGANGQNFEANGPGRSVLLYSYRPDPSEIANGDDDKEQLAVRVLRSDAVEPLEPTETALGRHVLAVPASGLGIVRSGASPTSIVPGKHFSVDFWVDLSSTTSSVVLVDMGDVALTVTADPVARTLSADYYGISVTRPLPDIETDWRHVVVQAYESLLGGFTPRTSLILYLDGVATENAMLNAAAGIPAVTPSTFVGSSVQTNSLRFGVSDAASSRIDQIRLYKYTGSSLAAQARLSFAARKYLRTGQGTAPVSGPLLRFDFETAPAVDRFVNQGSVSGVGLGIVSGDPRERVNLQEVATRIKSVLDKARFGSGYTLNEISNYNVDLYQRGADVGAWGPLYPVNHTRLFTGPREFQVAYFENPYLDYPESDEHLHPNVAWPYVAATYTNVVFPVEGPHKDKRIYIASRVGSEGVDANGALQQVFDTGNYANLAIYNQPERDDAGFNPNEEHALAVGSYRAALKVKTIGESAGVNTPLAAFALQNRINELDPDPARFTSEPWVLVAVDNQSSGDREMAAYRVDAERAGVVPFPRPLDGELTAGLTYESAANPEDRFLTMDPSVLHNFAYQFDYPVFAGDLLIPPYPLNLVVGNVTMLDDRGGNLRVAGDDQRTFWKDVRNHAWVVSGDGRFFNQYFYPFRSDFYLPDVTVGTPVAWLADNPQEAFTGGDADTLNPVPVIYNSFWRSDYPKLKRGETLTYQGGEYFNENPGSEGLPALVAMKAAEVIYDSATPDMIDDDDLLTAFSARVIRPLDRREASFSVADMDAAGFSPAAAEKIFIVAERWYFKELPGSLQRRFYFDSLAEKLVFRGYLNDKDSGDSDLTAGPDPLNILEPNILTADEYSRLKALAESAPAWVAKINSMYLDTQNPHGLTNGLASVSAPVFQAGIKEPPANHPEELRAYWLDPTARAATTAPTVMHLDSFGVGSALVCNQDLLTRSTSGSLYITIVENNRIELDGAPIGLHIVEIVPDRYRGAIKVIEGADAFSEKISLQHNGEFGANTDNLYYEWWIRDAASLDTVADEVLTNGMLTEIGEQGQSLWQEYIPVDRQAFTNEVEKRAGLHSIVFEGRPDITLADKLVLMRYRHKSEAGWTLVPLTTTQSASALWQPGSAGPFQWAGAANSPQLQADGSKRYIPQLVMGWIKRILDRINPYEARYTDFFGNESPATYSSQIQIAGPPFAGKVALNPDKNVIENTGLIELYETVLARAKELSLDNSSNASSTPGIDQALLLAGTRLSVLYELLAREAYSDAQDSTIQVSAEDELASVVSFAHAFENQEANLLHEELALLRGSDFRKSYPIYNRMIWNYVKGLGEAAYNVNYNIYDENTDGFINEDDARALFPMGHGDAWGHFVSALDKTYELLRHPLFDWEARSELYSLMENVIETDYLDEKTFARLAAGKARAGRDIVRGTYRLYYTQEPDGQWQGYTDGVDPARAWGVSEWAHRAGHGAYFDWAVANAILPDELPDAENLDRLDRSAVEDEIGEIAGALYEIELAMDEANGGHNPLGFDADALSFDIDPYFDGVGWERNTHFEQIYQRAVVAGANALATLNLAAKSGHRLRRIASDTDALIVEAIRQDLDYRNRLIEIFGRPYDGTIGFGKTYPEGFEGADTLLFAYLDHTTIAQIVPSDDTNAPATTVTFNGLLKAATSVANSYDLRLLYADVYGNALENVGAAINSPYAVGLGLGSDALSGAFVSLTGANTYEDFTETVRESELPIRARSAYAFQSGDDWGQRTSYGKLQNILERDLRERIELDAAINTYVAFLQDFEVTTLRLQNEVELVAKRASIDTQTGVLRLALLALSKIKGAIVTTSQTISGTIGDTARGASETTPKNLPTAGFSFSPGDALAPVRGGIQLAAVIAKTAASTTEKLAKLALDVAEGLTGALISDLQIDARKTGEIADLEGLLIDLVSLSGNDIPMRNAIGVHQQNLELIRQEYFTAQAEGFRLLREREAFNKVLAASVQRNRYEDMIFRLSRNEAMGKYQTAFNHAARYAWLAARAYDYETSLDPGDPAAPGALLDDLVKERQLGLWTDGQPQVGQGGIAETLAMLFGNYQVLKGQLGLNNPQSETEKISLRHELFRIRPAGTNTFESDRRWKEALLARKVDNLLEMPEFMRYCRPFADRADGPQPGLVIRFSTEIEPGRNIFGNALLAGDHSYSVANFATKIRGFGVWMDGYNDGALATTPRAYLVPVGTDYMRVSTADQPVTRMFGVQEQRIPTPFVLNPGSLTAPDFIPSLNGIDGAFSALRRHGDFRIYHNAGNTVDEGEMVFDSRLISRSVWNSQWMLIIPGANLDANPDRGLETLAETITDIKLFFKTYSHQGL